MKLFGQHAPGEQEDGYIPGAWDEVVWAYADGHISEEAYELLHDVIKGPHASGHDKAPKVTY